MDQWGGTAVTWWGAVGLALALYGVVVLLEWVYGRLTQPSDLKQSVAVSLVVRVKNQEQSIEHTLRELISLWTDHQWRHSDIEVLISDGGSRDQTAAIIERVAQQYPYFRVADRGLDPGAVMGLCRYPVVIWVDFSPDHAVRTIIPTVHRLLAQMPLRSKNLAE